MKQRFGVSMLVFLLALGFAAPVWGQAPIGGTEEDDEVAPVPSNEYGTPDMDQIDLTHEYTYTEEVTVAETEGRGDEQVRYLRVGDLLLDRTRLNVISEGESVPLTPCEYRLLLCLVENAGSTVSFGALAEAVHGVTCEEGAAKRAISTHLWRLRRKLGAVARSTVEIANIRGEGYVLRESQAD